MKTNFVLFLLIFCFSLIQFSFAQSFTLNGNGARAAGMGYAFTGIADDATAISWNAAGLAQLYSMEANIVGRFGFGSLNTNYSDVEYKIERGSSFQINFASFIIPFSAGDYYIVGGVAYRNIYDFTKNLETNITYTDNSTYESTDDRSGGINAITPALAFQLNEMVSFGAAVNILMGSYERDYDNSNDFDYSSSVDYSGLIMDLSVLLKPNPQFSIGANISLPNTITFEGEDSDPDKWTTEMDVPMFVSVGAAFRATDNFSIAADYRSRPWSSREISKYVFNGIDIENPNEQFIELPDANSFHIGMEYLMGSGNSLMPLRFGFYTLPTTNRESSKSGMNPKDADQISYNVLTAGIGIVMKQIIINGSLEYVFGSYVGGYENEYPVDYAYNDFRITIGATIHLGQN